MEIGYATSPSVAPYCATDERMGAWRFFHPHKYERLSALEKSQAHRLRWKHGLCSSVQARIQHLAQYTVPHVVKRQWQFARRSVCGPLLVAYQSDSVRRLLGLIGVPGVDLRLFGAPLFDATKTALTGDRKKERAGDDCGFQHDFDRPCQVEVAKRLVE